MAPLKNLLVTYLASALALSRASSECEKPYTYSGDQTALLQSHLSHKSDLALSQQSSHSAAFFPALSNLNDPHTRKAALLEIEKTAVKLASMDRTEATDTVILVCTETAELLNTTVLYNIIQEDAADRAALESAYGEFDQWETQRQQAIDALAAAEGEVASKATIEQECTTREIETCINETICTTHTNDHCEERDRVEAELVEIDREIHDSWCLSGAVRTATYFRTESSTIFRRYIDTWTELQRLMGLCDDATEHCQTTLQTYLNTRTECMTKTSNLWHSSCELYHTASRVLNSYQQGYLQTLTTYNDQVATIMIREADRKVEWDVLTRVICLLLTLTNEDDGATSSQQTEASIQKCWDEDVDVQHLDIDYLDPPPMHTVPTLPPYPCTAEYESHYDLGVPSACTALEDTHSNDADLQCTCGAEMVSDQGLELGFYLLVDPALDMEVVNGDEWHINLDGSEFRGRLSAPHISPTGAFDTLSQDMLTEDQLQPTESDGSQNPDYTGEITTIRWAYPSVDANWIGGLSLAQRFAMRGGMVFLNSQNQVVDVRELASASAPMSQPATATMSLVANGEPITSQAATSACPYMHDIDTQSSRYAQGARRYCWVFSAYVDGCHDGCFIYEQLAPAGTVFRVFSLVEGLHIHPMD